MTDLDFIVLDPSDAESADFTLSPDDLAPMPSRGEAKPLPRLADARKREASAIRWRRMKAVRQILPNHRVSGCGHRPSTPQAAVSLRMSPSRGDVRAHGCHPCGCVWICPVCAARITETRARDLMEGTRVWVEAANTVALLTLTIPHGSTDGLADLLTHLNKAMTLMRGHGAYKIAAESVVHVVRATEVTWGSVSGWHPHFHLLLMINGKPSAADLDDMRESIARAWRWAAEKAGLPAPDLRFGCDLAVGKSVHERLAAYLAKSGRTVDKSQGDELRRGSWGIERELTKLHTKNARKAARFAPFQLLDAFAAAVDASERAILMVRFLEFVSAMRGARQLFWSRGSKDALREMGADITCATDSALAAAPESDEYEVATVSGYDWARLSAFRLADPLLRALTLNPTQATARRFLAISDRMSAKRMRRLDPDPDPLKDVPFLQHARPRCA